MVTLGESKREVQKIADDSGVIFNENKLVFHGIPEEQKWEVQGKVIQRIDQYRYLGIHFGASNDLSKIDARVWYTYFVLMYEFTLGLELSVCNI